MHFLPTPLCACGCMCVRERDSRLSRPIGRCKIPAKLTMTLSVVAKNLVQRKMLLVMPTVLEAPTWCNCMHG